MVNTEIYGDSFTPGSIWVGEVFRQHDVLRDIPSKILTQTVSTMGRYLEEATNPDVRRRVASKIVHSGEVVVATFDITALTPAIPWNVPQALSIGLLHDIGRLEQASLGEFWRTHIFLRHGEAGARIAEGFDFSDTGVDKDIATTAIAKHDLAETGTVNPYVLLVKDADRLALFRDVVATNFFTNRQVDGDLTHISPLVKEDFLAGRLVLNEHLGIGNLGDEILRMLAWITDISYLATQQLLRNEHLIEGLQEQLKASTGDLDPEVQLRINELMQG
jgi:hypothetical protein